MFGSFLALIVITALVAGWIATSRITREVEAETRHDLRRQVDLLTELLGPALRGPRSAGFQDRVRELGQRLGTRVTVIAADGVVLGDSAKDPRGMDNHGSRPEVLASLAQAHGEAVRYSDTLEIGMVYVARRVGEKDEAAGFVRGALPLIALEERLGSLRATLLGAAGIAVLVGLALALIAARAFARPLASLRAAATALASGEYDQRVLPRSSDEVGDLGRAFNEMAGRLEHEITTIRRDRRELRAILAGMVEGVLAVDQQERIVLSNDAAGKILGFSVDEVRGRPLWEALRLPQVPDALSRAVKQGALESTQITLPEQGRERTVRLHVSPLQGDDGAHRGAILVLDDITEIQRVEKIRRDFIANASHELKTPVASIRGMTETILGDPDMDPETRRRFTERILSQSHRLGDLVEEMLALSRLESQSERVASARIDVRVAVQEMLEVAAPQASERGVRIRQDLGNEDAVIEGHAESVRRIAGNLLDNAIKYSPEGGEIVVRLGVRDGNVLLEVADQGPGIAADKHDRIFERFYRVDEGRARGAGGTGLGLAIVKHLVQSLGGRVELESTVGLGSTFRVLLPPA